MAPIARTARRELAVATATTTASSSSASRISTSSANSTPARDCYPSYRSTQSTTPDSDREIGYTSSSSSYIQSDPDSDSEADIRPEPVASGDANDNTWKGDIAECKFEGPARPRHKPQTEKLWKSEREIWNRYCLKIMKKTKMTPEAQLLACQPEIFKGYLRWRKRHYRVKKQSSMTSYWKRISQCYRDVAGRRMDANTLDDICNWIPTIKLDTSESEKHAMYVQDLYATLHALWIDDRQPLHGLVRIFISLLLISSSVTGSRPAAIVALAFKDIEIMMAPSLKHPGQGTILVNVNLDKIKNISRGGNPKKFSFRLEELPASCLVSFFLAVGFCHNAFENNFTNVQQMFDLAIPVERAQFRFRWKEELLHRPFFTDVKYTVGGAHIQKETPFPCAKYRDVFKRMGREAGFESPVNPYQIRIASGRNLNNALNAAERNQTMDHSSVVCEKYYTPTHIARDFQSIYFGTPKQEELIRSVASMSILRDRRVPTELNDKQLDEIRNHPDLVALRVERKRYKEELHAQSFYPLANAEGTDLYRKYMDMNSKISTKQLRGEAATEVLRLPAVEFELRERATVANMLFKPFPDDKARVRFCSFAPSPYALDQEKAAVKKEPTLPLCGTVQEELYPKKLLHPVCLICIGNSGFSHERRLRPWPRKDVLNKHIKAHFEDPEFQAAFSCRHPRCQGVMLDGIMHFKRHALDVHGVTH
ncbi:hypothetical protein EJ04DRAFT_606100 [Polyplosphaeria fusca]|uniref:C2H2-type domain-containing protein n=1 Tax=Polyplosphaeria fusca TaxID=682080 RepID=A0A9P4R658_9PLEO|nr:hypothetical protein EJ04DRAFT_606100 [Polyplosphaeria fusca]